MSDLLTTMTPTANAYGAEVFNRLPAVESSPLSFLDPIPRRVQRQSLPLTAAQDRWACWIEAAQLPGKGVPTQRRSFRVFHMCREGPDDLATRWL